jgi:hypothetical protein
MGLVKICSADAVRNVLITITTLETDDGTAVNPVTAALPVAVAFPLVGFAPETATWLAAGWVTAADGSFRVRCQVGSAATGTLPPGRYQPYVQVGLAPETITVPAADVLESY